MENLAVDIKKKFLHMYKKLIHLSYTKWLLLAGIAICIFALIFGICSSRTIPTDLMPIINKEARNFGIDPLFLASIIQAESSGRVKVISQRGACGLMQLMPATAEELAKELKMKYHRSDLFYPEINIRLGTYYIYKLLRRFNNNTAIALAAYNTGPTRVARWLRESPNQNFFTILKQKGSKETISYVYKILNDYNQRKNLQHKTKLKNN